MTGQREIVELCGRLEKRFGTKKKGRIDDKTSKDRGMGAAEGKSSLNQAGRDRN
jgi:hypothetical protein